MNVSSYVAISVNRLNIRDENMKAINVCDKLETL